MREILIAGNPNVGKSTLFNSLTKSNEHTGNFHGVTVEGKSKIVNFENETIKITDLPGIYSLNTFSFEEEVAKNVLIKNNSQILMLCDANCLKKNLYLCLQLSELGISYKILINNYDYFISKGNGLDFEKFKSIFKNAEIINAKKVKLTEKLINTQQENALNLGYLDKYIAKVQGKFNLDKYKIIKAFNGDFSTLKEEQIEYVKTFYQDIIKDRYNYIDNLLSASVQVEQKFIYGVSKLDKFFLNPLFMFVGFFAVFLASIYGIFFILGPFLTDKLNWLFELVVSNPIMNLLYMTTDNVWILEFVRSGILSSITSVLGFLPQICLLFIFLTILEDSGIISRMAFVLDDFLSKLGLNGKAVYTILLGFGCNTMSTMASRNMDEKNLKIKTALINPYLSCVARLPVYLVVAVAFFKQYSFWVIAGLYFLGVVVALVLSFVLNKTILKTPKINMLLEFAPMRKIDFKHVLKVAKSNAIDFVKRVFSVVVCVGIIVWIVSHTGFDFKYTENISSSILFALADKIAFVFAPIGLNSSGLVCALIVGILAKELIVTTMSICNNVSTDLQLSKSLCVATSVISLTSASAVSFLIFSLLYCPCISNLAVLKKETDKFYMWFAIISQFTIAYLLSFVVYQALTKGWLFAMLMTIVITIIMAVIIFIIKKVKQGKCLTCGKCK